MPPKITYGSYELVCFHEAGHAATAIQVGAQINEIEIYEDNGRYFGRTNANRTDEQSRHILLGGFAAEYQIYEAGRLVKPDGNAPDKSEFIYNSIRNATIDRQKFFELQFNAFLTEDEEWPTWMDKAFVNFAIGRAKNEMPSAAVERIAYGLSGQRKLDGDAIRAAFDGESAGTDHRP
ncbi:hypothetical protein [Bosea sp. 685]|uniref:hypothetical protein n=1 Tax=Bosea sp. 685 TaxID=3080057 RepID=UPI002892ABAB|nr:hypothetical protein [Bosea sp. 685]WNJ90077.1 hypothetical protein RMR04_27425 [Bosea sp. 685]